MNKITVLDYQTATQIKPYREWFNGLRDQQGKAIIEDRISKVRRGIIGKFRGVGEGVFELKIYYGPGYRVYYHHDGPMVVILLCGGDKNSQYRDIKEAKEYSRDYWRRKP